MVTKEMLHAEIDRLTDAQTQEVHGLLCLLREHAGDDTNPRRLAQTSKDTFEGSRDEDALGRLDFAKGVARDFEDWPAADKELPDMRGLFGRSSRTPQDISGNLEAELPDAGNGQKRKGLLARLQEIQIDGPEDFAENFDLYASGEKRV